MYGIVWIMNKPMKDVLERAFNAGMKFGKDSMNTTTRKYDYEMTEPSFDEWYKKFSLTFHIWAFDGCENND